MLVNAVFLAALSKRCFGSGCSRAPLAGVKNLRGPGCVLRRGVFFSASNPGFGRSIRGLLRWGLFASWTSSGQVRRRGSIPWWHARVAR